MKKMEQIKSHFEEEAGYYDEIILKIIPFYQEMVDAIVSSIPFERTSAIKILDLGCGTGTISKAIWEKYPNGKFTIVDISQNMLNIAERKVGEKHVSLSLCRDFYELDIEEKFDGVVSSLALHHLISDEDKIHFYTKIFKMLKMNGVFYNGDIVLGANEQLQNAYMEKWISYIHRTYSMDEIHNNWLVRYKNEDSPARLSDQIKWLENIGFSDVEVIWKYYNFSVYGGMKKCL